METIKLYDENAYLNSFSANVVACEMNGKGKFEIVLDATAFFPEEGGQSCDKGEISGKEVLAVRIENGIIYHIMDEPLGVGDKVSGKIDFAHRFRNMQHHSAEHIVSGLVDRNFGYKNVGFHLGSGDMTMDYDGEFDKEKIEFIEKAANRAVYENVEIIAQYPEKEILKELSYRSKLDLEDNVRIVTVKGYDVCACCAPHVKRTGEIGVIKIVDYYRYKGGTRVHALCGYDAICDYISKHNDLKETSIMLSSKINETPKAVSRVLEENSTLSLKISELGEKCAKLIAKNVGETEGCAVVFEEGLSSNEMRVVANELVAKTCLCGVFCVSEKETYSFIIASGNVSCKSVLEKLKDRFEVRGGGSDKMVQGTISGNKEKIAETLKHI